MKGIGFRTVKTALGAGLAIWLATLLELEFATFAGIVVIISIEKTKKKTLITLKDKFIASILALLLGTLFFEVLGYLPFTFSLFVLLFIPILAALHVEGGFVTSAVVILHIYTIESISVSIFLNEIYIILIGMGIVVLVNSVMSDLKQDIAKFKLEIEEKFTVILYEFSAHLKDQTRQWDGMEMSEVEVLIDQAKDVAIQDAENQLLGNERTDYYYFEMRGAQLELLKQMMRMIAVVASRDIAVQQKTMLADFLDSTSRHVHSGNTTESSLMKLEELMTSIRETGLPKTREEFETRANLYYIVFEMENYFKIKRKLFSKKS